jgi:hypothetical protein
VICEDVENCPSESMVKLKPVMAVAAMGETPMSPVMEELGTVAMPVLARMTYSPATPRSTVEGEEKVAEAALIKAESNKRFNFMVGLDGVGFVVCVGLSFVRFGRIVSRSFNGVVRDG